MHFKNGREAKAGDKAVNITTDRAGILHTLNAQSITCNARLATVADTDPYVNLSDCLHVDDIAAAVVPDSTKIAPVVAMLAIMCLLCALFTSPAKAQTSTEVTPELAATGLGKVFNWLKTNDELLSTNKTWTFIPYASHAKGLLDKDGNKAEWGGGIALMHPINDSDYFRGGFRLQSLGGEIVLPSVNAQFQSSYHVPGTKAVSTFFGFTGLAAMAGGSQENGKLGMLFGLGVSVKYPINEHWDIGIAYAVEQWTNLKVGQVDHGGLIVTLKF